MTPDAAGDDNVVAVDGPGAGARGFLWLAAALIAAFVAWAGVGRLDVVSSAVGEVVPSSQVKTVQHLEGGIVSAFHVREGDEVVEGQPLVSLEPTQRGADVEELAARIGSLRVDIARLEAEAAGASHPAFADDLRRRHPELVAEAEDVFAARRARLRVQLAEQRQIVAQRQFDARLIAARQARQREMLRLQQEQIRISDELLKDDLTNRMLHLNLLKDAAELRGRIAEDEAALPAAEAAVGQARSRLQAVEDTYMAEVREALAAHRRSFEEMSNRLRKYEDSLKRMVLRSPVDGIVKTLHVVTVGGVVAPGGTVAEIVPKGDRLIIEARLPSQEIGYVRPGQSVNVQLASSDAARFGTLTGEVVEVSPDTLATREGVAYYRVRVTTERDYFEQGGLRYRLVPGVRVTCSILTGTRRVGEYLLDPFLRSLQTAMRER